MDPSHRRVQAFMLPSYHDMLLNMKLKQDDINEIVNQYQFSIDVYDKNTFVCAIYNKWADYCGDYDKGVYPCTCNFICDVKARERPTKYFKSFEAVREHILSKHKNCYEKYKQW